jgi:DNA polymerase III alpha subunit (gram-positive type)
MLHVPPDSLSIDMVKWFPINADLNVLDVLSTSDKRYVVVDVETTGFWFFEGAQVTEISWYCLNSGFGGTFIPKHSLQNSDPESLKISRYEERISTMIQDDGTQVRALHSFLGGDGVETFLVGSNPSFDAEHLGALFASYGLDRKKGSFGPWNFRTIDPVAGFYWQESSFPVGEALGLKKVADFLGLNLDNHHSAKADVEAVAVIWHEAEKRRRKIST